MFKGERRGFIYRYCLLVNLLAHSLEYGALGDVEHIRSSNVLAEDLSLYTGYVLSVVGIIYQVSFIYRYPPYMLAITAWGRFTYLSIYLSIYL